jgi:ABC-type methionine transport system permease subunit
MTTTTDVVRKNSRWETYRRHGYFFREAAMLTIAMGVALHIYRVIFGDVTGILLLVHNRVRFANKRHRALFTGSVVYILGSVPLHIYCSYIIVDTTLLTWFPMWFSYFLLIMVYPVFLAMFWKLTYAED